MKYLSLILFLFSAPGFAGTFVWKDAVSQIRMAYPDNWRQVTSYSPIDIVTLKAPATAGDAKCVLKSWNDDRFKRLPARYSASVAAKHFSADFWENDYLPSYQSWDVQEFINGTGIGRGFGSIIMANVETAHPIDGERRKIMAAVSHYYDRTAVLECSTRADHYASWAVAFGSILKSAKFQPLVNQIPGGYYTDFPDEDDRVQLRGIQVERVQRY